MWIFCIIASMACLFAVPLLFLAAHACGAAWTRKVKVMNLLLACVFVAAVLVFFPIHLTDTGAVAMGGLGAFLVSAFNSIQLFAAGCDYTVVTEGLSHCPLGLQKLYQCWAALLYVVAPVVTFGFVLSLFKNISAYISYLRMYWRDVYVFTELNERALTLAEDLKEKHPRVCIVFAAVFEKNEEVAYELLERAKALNAICFKKDVLAIAFGQHSAKKDIFFFAIGSNESENLNQSLQLIDSYRDRANTHLFIFSTKVESELLLTAVDKGRMKVRRVNEVHSLVNRVLYERGEIIFDSARTLPDGTKRIGAVVVGMGRHGTEMVKALSWFCQMDGYDLKIDAFDRGKRAESTFIAQVPELMSPRYNGVYVPGEAYYQIKIHDNTYVETEQFAQKIAQLRDTTYVLVALGDDDVNINTAVTLRMYFERMGIHPVIQAIVYNSEQKAALQGIKNYRNQDYDIDFIGDLRSSYTEAVIMDSELEEDALQRHLKRGKEEEFWTYEYNYRSSVASAIHLRARIKCGIPGADKAETALTPEERDAIETLEHRRWNAYMRSEGYVFSGSTDKASRNDLAKMHHDLVEFASLTEEEKRKDSQVGTISED